MNTVLDGPIKPGYLTTEFWVTVVTFAGTGLVFIFHRDFGIGANSAAIAQGMSSLVGAAYAISRALIKAKAATVLTPVASIDTVPDVLVDPAGGAAATTTTGAAQLGL